MVKKGRKDIHGIILVDKPAGITSAAVVGKIQRHFGLRKVGHAGTLDPLATGLLPICINEATKLADHLAGDRKVYRARFTLGIETDTHDTDGTVVRESEVDVSEDTLRSVLETFVGPLEQVPPAFSAKKINGKPAYSQARAGKEVSLRACSVLLRKAELLAFDGRLAELRLDVSTGFYVRALARDIGLELGCGAAMNGLVREAHGVFSLDRSTPLDAILENEKPDSWIIPLESEDIPLPMVRLSEEATNRVRHGHGLDVGDFRKGFAEIGDRNGRIWRAIGSDGKAVALMRRVLSLDDAASADNRAQLWIVERGIVQE